MEALAFAVVVVVCVWLLDRRDRRHQDDRARMLQLLIDEREAMAQRMHDERVAMETARAQTSPDLAELVGLVDRLCQRLQAPEQAIIEHVVASQESSPPAVSMFDDRDYWESKEQLAERAAMEELAQREVEGLGAR